MNISSLFNFRGFWHYEKTDVEFKKTPDKSTCTAKVDFSEFRKRKIETELFNATLKFQENQRIRIILGKKSINFRGRISDGSVIRIPYLLESGSKHYFAEEDILVSITHDESDLTNSHLYEVVFEKVHEKVREKVRKFEYPDSSSNCFSE